MTNSEMKSQQLSQITKNLEKDMSVIKECLTTEGLLQIFEPLIRKFMSERDEEEQGKVMRQQFDWVISISHFIFSSRIHLKLWSKVCSYSPTKQKFYPKKSNVNPTKLFYTQLVLK